MDKVVITGYGVKAPNAYNKEHFKNSLENGTYELDYFNSTTGKRLVIGRVPDEELGEHKDTRYARVVKLGLAAAKEALEMAKLTPKTNRRVTVIFGSASGPTGEAVITNESCFREDPKSYPLLGIGLMSYHSIASAVIGELGVGTKALTVVTGCNSGSDALYMAKLLLDSNKADIVIVGSADAPLCEPVFYGFNKLRMAEADIGMSEAGIPFSSRNKFIISEGSAVVVLEKESSADERKVKKFGELINVDSINDGLSAYKSDKSGVKMLQVVSDVTNGIIPTYINSQALGLKENDTIELFVRSELFNNEVPITSIKGVTGHPFGAMGMLQMVSSLISIENNFIPKTKTTLETEKLDIVTKTTYQSIETVCITTHGFGGNSSCILLGKV